MICLQKKNSGFYLNSKNSNYPDPTCCNSVPVHTHLVFSLKKAPVRFCLHTILSIPLLSSWRSPQSPFVKTLNFLKRGESGGTRVRPRNFGCLWIWAFWHSSQNPWRLCLKDSHSRTVNKRRVSCGFSPV